MYNQKSKRDSIKIITWTVLALPASILLIFIGRGIYSKFNEGVAFGYIGLSCLFLTVLVICIKIFFEIKNSIEKNGKEKHFIPYENKVLDNKNKIQDEDKDFFKDESFKETVEVDNKWPEGTLN